LVNMSERKITSRVLTKVTDWADESYLIPHEPLRWDLLECQRMLDEKHFDGTVQWKVDAFYKWYETFSEIVHHHHDTEEKIFFPLLSKRTTIPERLTSDHATLLKQMADIEASKKNFENVKNGNVGDLRKAGDNLRKLWLAFAADMEDHLAEEERVMVPMVRDFMTKEEHDTTVQKLLKEMGMRGNSIMLPWIERAMRVWKGDAATDAFLSTIPAPIRALNTFFWRPAYQRDNWGRLHSLEADTPPSQGTSLLIPLLVAGAAAAAGLLYYARH